MNFPLGNINWYNQPAALGRISEDWQDLSNNNKGEYSCCRRKLVVQDLVSLCRRSELYETVSGRIIYIKQTIYFILSRRFVNFVCGVYVISVYLIKTFNKLYCNNRLRQHNSVVNKVEDDLSLLQSRMRHDMEMRLIFSSSNKFICCEMELEAEWAFSVERNKFVWVKRTFFFFLCPRCNIVWLNFQGRERNRFVIANSNLTR